MDQRTEALLHRIVADLAAIQLGLNVIAIAERMKVSIEEVEVACKFGAKHRYLAQHGRSWFASAAAIRELQGARNKIIDKGIKDWIAEARTGMTKSGERSEIRRAAMPSPERHYCTDPESAIDVARAIARLGISQEELPYIRNCAECGALAVIRTGSYCPECRRAYDKHYNQNRRKKGGAQGEKETDK